MALAPLLYNITFDSQTRILYFWDKAGHEIYHCEIPSHAPALPTVTREYLYPSTTYGQIINVSSGSTCDAWRRSSGGTYSGVLYDDTTKKQCIFGWSYYESQTWYHYYGGIEIVDNGAIEAKNTTSGTIKVFMWRYAECDSPDATVITVYDSSNNPYNAFQYTSDGTDYYYVLDGTQTDWTDDLASIGYYLPADDDDLSKPLMLKATQDNSSVALTRTGSINNSYQYSLDGITWNQYTLNTSIPLSADEYVFFKRLGGSSTPSSSSHHYFVMTGQIEAYNNINSMFFDSGWETADTLTIWCGAYLFDRCSALTRAPALPATTLSAECYYRMFRDCTSLTNAPYMCAENLATYCCEYMFEGCTSLVNAPELSAMTLASYCYYHMFDGCTSFVNAPNLPATTLADNCYGYMFKNCTSLVNAPALPATTLADNCYGYMFNNCTSLVNAPALPATTLAYNCYGYMFKNCTSLVNAPALPATTLADNCYHDMFWKCISLTKAPVLPATVLATYCYSYMFEDCSNLSEIHILAADISASGCLSHWLEDASSTGDIYCVNGVNYPVGISGIPSGWTRHDI